MLSFWSLCGNGVLLGPLGQVVHVQIAQVPAHSRIIAKICCIWDLCAARGSNIILPDPRALFSISFCCSGMHYACRAQWARYNFMSLHVTLTECLIA